MTITLDAPVTLRAATDHELQAAYLGAGDDLGAEVLAEARRRDDADRRRQQRRFDPVASEWRDMAHQQFLQAEDELRGNLVRRGSLVADAFSLWSGTQAWAESQATSDLIEWWRDHPRVTVTQYRNQLHRAKEIYADDCLGSNETGPVRHERAAASADRTVPGAGPVRNGRPGRPAARAMSPAEARADRAERVAGLRERIGQRAESGDVSAARARLLARQGAPYVSVSAGQHQAGPVPGAPAPGRAETAVAVRERGQVATRPADGSGAEVLGYVRAMLAEYASFPSEAALDAVALWAAHAHVRDRDGRLAWRATPRLLLMSSEPGSGKSRVLELLGRICPHTFGLDTEPTAAALAHTLDKEHATVLIDEADVLFGRGQRREAVRAVINSGYTAMGTVLRMRGQRADRARVFGPMAIAGLDVLEKSTGDALSATLDRCVIIRMTRAEGHVADLTERADRAGWLLRSALATWTQAHLAGLVTADPEMPEGVHGRTAQIWQPLIAIADAAGGNWPERARAACEELAMRGGVSGDMQADAMDELAEMFGTWDSEDAL